MKSKGNVISFLPGPFRRIMTNTMHALSLFLLTLIFSPQFWHQGKRLHFSRERENSFLSLSPLLSPLLFSSMNWHNPVTVLPSKGVSTMWNIRFTRLDTKYPYDWLLWDWYQSNLSLFFFFFLIFLIPHLLQLKPRFHVLKAVRWWVPY